MDLPNLGRSRLISAGVADVDADLRKEVLLALGPRFVSVLAEPSRLRAIGIALHDESLQVRLVAVPLLGRLSSVNPAVAMPLLRRALLAIQRDLLTVDFR